MSRTSTLGTLTSRIVQDLGEAIVAGEYSGDRPFPFESGLCERYEASRSVVREATKVLAGKGLISGRQRRGTFVRPDREWNILDPDVLEWMLKRSFSLPLLLHFTRARRAIEPAAASEAARIGAKDQHDHIGKALDRLSAAEEGRDQPLEADIAFHLAVIEASNNPFFVQMSPMVETALRFSIQLTNSELRLRAGSARDHGLIYQAICKRQEKKAAAATKALLDEALEAMLSVQKRQSA